MTRSFMLMMTMILLTTGTALAQQVVVQPQVVAQPRVVTQPQMAQPTRSYRSYSVNPTNVPRGKAGRDGTHAGESTWRHAGAKAHGNYGSGR
jgi:hypothetical protein